MILRGIAQTGSISAFEAASAKQRGQEVSNHDSLSPPLSYSSYYHEKRWTIVDVRYGEEEEEEMVADVDLYRVLHAGGSLHRRGYRQSNTDARWEEDDDNEDEWNRRQSSVGNAPVHRAAMKESMAAGVLLEAGWDKLVLAARGDDKGAVLVDPTTGSGTFPTEAALIACDIAPGLLRIASWRGRTHIHAPIFTI